MRKLDKATVFSIDEGNTFKYFSKKDFPDSKKVTCIIAIADMSKKLKVKRIYITKQIQLKRIGEEVFLVKSNGRLGNRITVEPCRRGYGYCRLLHAAHNSNKWNHIHRGTALLAVLFLLSHMSKSVLYHVEYNVSHRTILAKICSFT